ncbi:glyceraldehyde-3-phosphate dehydrogenase B, chloroplastic-like [Dorcoceras hygrometricum]|uniref:Glyceraldehyde-3-phosphate dehydrogenase B, chloroplastic-like n=1 Tax=Dorcoceras hygrometricum TaxID=472368 RepID=A0A2Z7BH46_9LAMI|nr:glyceraldehyde-3-phosphate dehydrogenase B, chloroplastic-like [Dorcoceras hygrometricum]
MSCNSSCLDFEHPEVDQEGSTRRFDLTPHVQTRSNSPQVARTHSHEGTPARFDLNHSLKLTACAPAHTWAHNQIAHQLPPECASLRLCTALFSVLFLTALYSVFAHTRLISCAYLVQYTLLFIVF